MSHAANDRGHLRTEEQRAAEGWELSWDRREHSGGVDGGTGSDSSESQGPLRARQGQAGGEGMRLRGSWGSESKSQLLGQIWGFGFRNVEVGRICEGVKADVTRC